MVVRPGWVAVPLVALGTATTALPWWTAPAPVLLVPGAPTLPSGSLAGWEVTGWASVALVGLLVVAAAVAWLRSGAVARLLAGGAGAALAATGACVLVGWGPTGVGWPWVATAGGVLAIATTVTRPVWLSLLVVALAAATAVLVPGPPGPNALVAGRFQRVADLGGDVLRSGVPALPALGPTGRLVVVDGVAAVARPDGIVAAEPDGRARVVARSADPAGSPGILGVADGRVARWVAADRIAVTGLRTDDPVDVEIRNVDAAGPVGTDGSLWLRAAGDPPGTIRILPLDRYAGRQRLAGTFLPVVTISIPAGTVPVDVTGVLPVPDGAVRLVAQDGGFRVERITPTPGSATVTTLAGGLDAACGLTAAARDAHLDTSGPLAADPDGGVWLTARGRLLRIGPDGSMRAVADPLPGLVTAMVDGPDGTLTLALADGPGGPGLWRLPAAADALTDLPPAPQGCVPDPPRVGPPVTLVPVGTTGRDQLGVPLDTAGRWASQVRGRITAVAPGVAPVELGLRTDGNTGQVWPDGSGGVWWLEEGAGPGRLTPVHGRPGQATQRFPDVTNPAPANAAALLPDLGGRPPLMATAAGVVPLVAGAPAPPLSGQIGSGVVRADGRGWVVADGRLVTFTGATVLATVIDAGERRTDPTPTSVQLAKGVSPSALSLVGADVGLDAAGHAVVVCADGVVLRVDDSGQVAVIAQDPLATHPFTVEGGLVEYQYGTLMRIDLPT